MTDQLSKRLNDILPRITSEGFLSSEGIGNEIACYIFDYPAAEELRVREHLKVMQKHLETLHSKLRVLHLNLFDVVLNHLKQRRLLDKAMQMQATKGNEEVLRALKGPLSAEKIRDFIASEYQPEKHDLVLMSGVGSAWPLVRAHSLLNCLHTVMGTTPLVMFYPGNFDGTTLRLFGNVSSGSSSPGVRSYYRAFVLIP